MRPSRTATTQHPSAADDENLRALLRQWNPRYRRALLILGTLAVVVAGAAYLQNAALRALSESFRSVVPPDVLGLFEFARRIAPSGFGLPLVVLASFALLHAVRLASEFVQEILFATTRGRVRTDLEAALLGHLLRHEDRRTTERPVAEVLARIDQDVNRLVEQRVTGSRIRQAAFVAGGNLIYLGQIDLRLALALTAACSAAALLMQQLGRAAAEVDQHHVHAADRVRSALEETLWSRSEIHASGLLARARARVRNAQALRELTAVRSAQLSARLHVVNGSSYIATLSAMSVGVYFASARFPDAHAALIPVLLKAIPELFGSTREISDGVVDLRLAASSERRLLEFESPTVTREGERSPATEPSPGVRVDAATYQYSSPGGGRYGGVADVTIAIAPGTWTVVTGPSGSGKSTMAQLILGRLRPQRGTVRLDGREVSNLSDEERHELLTFMPETITLLDGTIRTNLAFGRGSDDDLRPPTVAQLELLEATGLGSTCRMKALDLHPSDADLDSDFGRRIAALRPEFRACAAQLGVVVVPFESGCDADSALVAEMLLGGRCRRGEASARLLARVSARQLRTLARTALGRRIAAAAERVLAEHQALLSAESYLEYTRLCAAPVEEPLWRLRSAEWQASSRNPVAMMRIGLTSLRSEVGGEFDVAARPEDTRPVRAILGEAMIPLGPNAIHPALTWRENAVFGRLSLANRRAAERLDAAFVEVLRGHALVGELTDRGLEYEVGSNGSRLSTGQRQLVALCRALLRDTRLVVLDEPTSALDAASRARVAAVLTRWKAGRILITVTHDALLMRAADQVRVVDGGRLVAEEAIPGAAHGEVSVT